MSTSKPVRGATPVAERLRTWRIEHLLAAGCSPRLAGALAADSRYDLHALLDLVDRGCPPELAARILAPLDDQPPPC